MEIGLLKIGVDVYSWTRLECVSIAQLEEFKFRETEENNLLRTAKIKHHTGLKLLESRLLKLYNVSMCYYIVRTKYFLKLYVTV